MGAFATLSRLLSLGALALSVAGLVGTTLVIFAAVVARYVAGSPLAFAEQAALLLMVWTVMLAAAAGVREGFHLRMTALTNAVSPRARQRMAYAAEAAVLLFGLMLAVDGTRLAMMTASHDIPALGLSRAWTYVPLALAGVLMILFSGERIIAMARRTEVEPSWPS